jgi:hypothetical protein
VQNALAITLGNITFTSAAGRDKRAYDESQQHSQEMSVLRLLHGIHKLMTKNAMLPKKTEQR